MFQGLYCLDISVIIIFYNKVFYNLHRSVKIAKNITCFPDGILPFINSDISALAVYQKAYIIFQHSFVFQG